MSIVYVTAASLAPRHHPGIDRHEQNPVCVESVWCVSYGSTMLRTWNQGQGSDWSVRGGIDTGPLVGDVQFSIWPMTPVEPSAPPVSVTRVGRVMALRKRNQTQQAEKNQNFKYHFHIPLSHTTAEINQKVVYTTQIPVNYHHWAPDTLRPWPDMHRLLLKPGACSLLPRDGGAVPLLAHSFGISHLGSPHIKVGYNHD